MGVPIEKPTICMEITCQPFTMLNALSLRVRRKCSSIYYHTVREAVAMGELLTGHVKTDENPAYLVTKVVGGGQKMKNFVEIYLYDIHDGW